MLTDFERIIDNHVPPTVFQLCESICYTNNTPCRIMDLAKNCRETIFNFDYPLTEKVDREKFEINIINHFLMRRIGGETFTAWQLFLYNKLNEIMPKYNLLFDALNGWELFNSGEVTNRTLNSQNQSKLENKSNNTTNNFSDRRFSDMPDNRIDDIKNGEYLTDYNFDTNTTNSNDNSNSNGTSTTNDVERIERTPSDKISIYNEFINNKNNIYTKIYEDLEVCFYGLCE